MRLFRYVTVTFPVGSPAEI